MAWHGGYGLAWHGMVVVWHGRGMAWHDRGMAWHGRGGMKNEKMLHLYPPPKVHSQHFTIAGITLSRS